MNTTLEKQGYKYTEEFAYIPEDWEVRTIKEFASIQTGTKNTEDKIENGLYPFFVRSQTVEYINEYAYDEEAVLTAGDGVGVGKVFHYINGKFNVHQRVYKISNFKNVIGRYFYLFFKNNFYSEVKKYTAKSSVDSVRLEMIADMNILIPPLKGQEKIAEVLGDVDSLIDKTQQLINKKKDLKTATLENIFENIEKNIVNLQDFVWFQEGPGVRNYQFKTQGIKLLNVGNLCDGKLNLNNTDIYISKEEAYGNYKHFLVDEGDLIMATSGIRVEYLDKKIAFAEKKHLPLCMNTSTIRFKSLDSRKLNIVYLKYFFNSLFFTNQIKQMITGSAQLNFGPAHLKQVKMILPNINVQNQIITILSDMDSEIEALEKELGKYKDLKIAMMQQLLTGKVRLI